MTERGNPNFDEYPVTVTLHFRDEKSKDEFMGGLSDGFGENFCDLDWPWRKARRGKEGGVIGFYQQRRFAVEVFDPADE